MPDSHGPSGTRVSISMCVGVTIIQSGRHLSVQSLTGAMSSWLCKDQSEEKDTILALHSLVIHVERESVSAQH